MADFSNLNIGAPAAERDELLIRCFVDTSIFQGVKAGSVKVLLGNRGAGKSAVFQKLKSDLKFQNHAIIPIEPEDYSYEIISSSLRSQLDGAWSKQSSFTAAWKYVLLIKVMIELRDRTPNTKNASYRKIHGFLRDKFRGQQFNLVDHLVSYLKRFEGITLGDITVEKKGTSLTSLYRLEEIYHLFENIRDLLRGIPVTIIVDELDRGWDASEDARLFVSGVFQAAMQLNSISPNLSVLISLRRELYDNIPELFDDAQKYRDVVRYITWTEDSLRDLAGKRICEVMGLGESADPQMAWESVFEETLSYRNTKSFNYIIDRTLYRPREIIQFCNECLSLYDPREGKIDYPTILRAESVYSNDRFSDICSEYRFQMPSLNEILNEFRGRVYSFSREEIEEFCVEVILRRGDSIE